ncbi:hypothetical protein B0J14DRAFT_560187 [Halenospora varia]|nr:hypothetical protein B0J14DRAFT_560187 [Halenospora varia]
MLSALRQSPTRAQTEGFKHYILPFSTTKDEVDAAPSSQPKIYINPAADTICLSHPETFMLYPTDDEEKVNFISQLKIIHLKSLAMNLHNWKSEIIRVVTIDVNVLCYGDILPVKSDAFEELILFSNARCYDYVESRRYSDMVNFRELYQEELETNEVINSFIVPFLALDAYFSALSTIPGPEEVVNYNSLRKRLIRTVVEITQVSSVCGHVTAACVIESAKNEITIEEWEALNKSKTERCDGANMEATSAFVPVDEKGEQETDTMSRLRALVCFLADGQMEKVD